LPSASSAAAKPAAGQRCKPAGLLYRRESENLGRVQRPIVGRNPGNPPGEEVADRAAGIDRPDARMLKNMPYLRLRLRVSIILVKL